MASVAEVSKPLDATTARHRDAAGRTAAASAGLFVVHDGDSDDWIAPLAAGLADGPTLHALRVGATMPGTVEALATQLLAQLSSRQTQGPYKLAGIGPCGVVAYEMAVQLVGRDEAVGFLGLIDTDCPAWPSGEAGAT